MLSRADQSRVWPVVFPGSISPRTPPFPGAALGSPTRYFSFLPTPLTRDLPPPETRVNLRNNSHIRKKKPKKPKNTPTNPQTNTRTKQKQYFNQAVQGVKGSWPRVPPWFPPWLLLPARPEFAALVSRARPAPLLRKIFLFYFNVGAEADVLKNNCFQTPVRSASPFHTRRHTRLSLKFMPRDCLASARQTAISKMSTFATISTEKTTPFLLLLSAHQK